jgi:hypothetical protein
VEDVVGILFLREEESVRSPLYLNAEEEVYRSKVLHRELKAELGDDALEKGRSRSSKHTIVDVQEKLRDVGAATQHEQRAVGLGGDEAEAV